MITIPVSVSLALPISVVVVMVVMSIVVVVYMKGFLNAKTKKGSNRNSPPHDEKKDCKKREDKGPCDDNINGAAVHCSFCFVCQGQSFYPCCYKVMLQKQI